MSKEETELQPDLKRESGFYWIRPNANDSLQPAEWDAGKRFWYILGSEQQCDEVYWVGDRI